MEDGAGEESCDLLLQSQDTEEGNLKRIIKESKILWGVAFPAIVARTSVFGLFVVTQAFMGHISELELSAYALVQTILMRFSNGILIGMACALETLCGQAYGAGQYHMMGIYMQRSWLVLSACLLLLLPFFIFATPLFKLLHENSEICDATGEIALWFIPVAPSIMFNNTLQMYLQAQMKNSIIGWLSTASFVLHVFLSWVMVDKLSWGVPGAMGSMVITSWLGVIGELVYVFGGWCPLTWKGFSKQAFSELWEVVKLSVSSGVMICLEMWYNAVLLLFAGYMNNAQIVISAFSICLNITNWALMLSIGFLSAASVRVSNELGKGDAKAAKFAIKVVISTSGSIGLLLFIVFLSLGRAVSYAFSSSEEVAEVVSNLSVLLAITILLNSVQPVFTGVAVGAGWQSVVAYVNIACYYGIGVPIGLLLAYVAHLQVKGIWIGMTCGIAVQTFALLLMTARTNWDIQVENAAARLDRWLLRGHEVNN